MLKMKIGSGTYGSVYRAIVNTQPLAIKRNSVPSGTTFIGSLRELDICMKLREHPHTVQLVSIAYHQPFEGIVSPPRFQSDRTDDIYLNFEYMDTQLQDYLNSLALKGQSLRQMEILELSFQILIAVEYLHSQQIIHRDIKPPNFLMSMNPFVVKICDFGLSRVHHQQGNLTPRLLTPMYRAWEICGGSTDYTMAVDCWSTGAILYQLVSGQPFILVDADDDLLILRQIFRKHPQPLSPIRLQELGFHSAEYYNNNPRLGWNDLLRGCDPGFRQVIAGLLEMDPVRRWSITRALDHPYWANWKNRRQEIYRSFPLALREEPYQIHDSDYLRTLLSKLVSLLPSWSTQQWYSPGKIFVLLNLIFRLTANLVDYRTLLPQAELHLYIVWYMVIKYHEAVVGAPSWQQVAPNYAQPTIMQEVRNREREILQVINYQVYSYTPYDLAKKKLNGAEIQKLTQLMINNYLKLHGKLPSEILQMI